MAKKYYVVWKGRQPGIFTDWATCKKQVDKFAGARYKSFPTKEEAEAAFSGGRAPAGTSPSKSSPARRRSGQSVKTYSADEVAAVEADIKIFTDGGCEPNPGQAGSGVAVYRDEKLHELWYGLYNPNGTNNTAELNALHQALLMAREASEKGNSVALFCDSKYSIQCVTQWAAGWEKKGWKKSGGEIKNLELIQALYALHNSLDEKLRLLHVNGHVGVEGNELADRMSILAISTRNEAFSRYADPLDIPAILAMRAG